MGKAKDLIQGWKNDFFMSIIVFLVKTFDIKVKLIQRRFSDFCYSPSENKVFLKTTFEEIMEKPKKQLDETGTAYKLQNVSAQVN